MATLRDIRRKIQSVTNIQKITKAMGLVAAARLNKAQAKAESSRPYAQKLLEILDRLIAATDHMQHPLMEKREVKKTGLVIIAGDRGLCGAYNQNVFNAAEKFLQKYSPEQVELFPVGRKTVRHFASKKWKVKSNLEDWGGKITFPQIEEFTKALMDLFLNSELDEIWLVYTHFIKVVAREVRVEKFLNIESSSLEEFKDGYIFEPDARTIFSEILPEYCITKIQSAFNDAYASELAARISSMQAAAKNAEEMIEKLTVVRNKIRQASITKELIEITSGAESLR
jgi:F-type H+-transporting ATPase subunit gamma